LTVLLLAFLAAAPQSDDGTLFFENHVRPLLVERCSKCHGPEKHKGGLRLDSIDAMLEGGDEGPAIVPGEPEKSLLVRGVRYTDELFQMPPTGKLPDESIALLEEWIRRGAPGPRGEARENAGAPFDLEARRAAQWAFQPLSTAYPPSVANESWVSEPLDRFVLARLEAAGVEPAPPVDRRTWIRRVSFDLIGLPPAPAEIDAFLTDGAEGAEARVVDRLLASPRFGEHWARHWLDLVGYAETRGHEFDHPLPNAWHYRDWVIRALNADLDYGTFVSEQIAGDLLPRPRVDPATGANESILGTGFWWLGEEIHSPVSTRADQCDRLAGRVDVLSRALLGMTVACARCHDHKFDAIAQKDFYALQGFQLSSSYRQVRFETMEKEREIAGKLAQLDERAQRALAPVLARELARDFERTSDALLASRELLRARERGVADETGVLESISARWRLEPAVVEAWVHEIELARSSQEHALDAWARSACASDEENVEPFRSRMCARPALFCDEPVGRLGVEGQLQFFPAPILGPLPWFEDGFSFGGRMRWAGEILLTNDPLHPVARILERNAACYEPAWSILEIAPDSQRDPGALNYPRSGRTWVSPTFTLHGPKLYLYVRGAGHCYAAVDGHKMIDGPLHARLVTSFEASQSFRWVEQDLSDYVGHRLHLEVTPAEGSTTGFELAAVAEGERLPGYYQPVPGTWIHESLVDIAPKTVTDLAAAYGSLFVRAIGRFEAFHESFDTATEHHHPTEMLADAPLLAWMCEHPELGGRTERSQLVRAAQGYIEERAALCASIPRVSRTAPAMLDGTGVDEYLLVRGNPTAPSFEVPRGLPVALAGHSQSRIEAGSGRLELAYRLWRQPLLYRVYANRVWYHLLGRGLVATVDDFGNMGEPPTHLELLDSLARQLMGARTLKSLVRDIVLSSTYRMSSTPNAHALEVDPKNLLWHHVPLERLTAEELRDSILAVSGRIDTTMYGPPVPVHLTDFMEGRGRPAESGPLDGDGRRSIYQAVRRNFLSPLALVFDYPPPATTMGRRSVSNVPAQALALMNDPFIAEEAQRWAERVLAEEPATDAARVDELWSTAFGRPAEEWERASALDFLAQRASSEGTAPDDARAWADLCHVLFNTKEFVYLR
jgi:hypothetical protein